MHTIQLQMQNKYWWDEWDYIYPKTVWRMYSGQSIWFFFTRYGTLVAAPLTGVILLFIMAAIFVTGHDKFRRRHWRCPACLWCGCCNCCKCAWCPTSCPCKRRKNWDPTTGTEEFEKFPGQCCHLESVDGYKVFWIFHDKKLLVFTFALTVFHAPARFLIWIIFPAMFAIMEWAIGKKMAHRDAILLKAEVSPGDVLTLYFKVPPGFVYQAGQYAEIFWRGERHPFTIVSAPEEGIVAFSIKAGDSLDWCSALRKRLIDYPLALQEGQGSVSEDPDAPPKVPDYKKQDLQGIGKGHARVFYVPNVTSTDIIYNLPVKSKDGDLLRDEKERSKMGGIFKFRLAERENERYEREKKKYEAAQNAEKKRQEQEEKKRQDAEAAEKKKQEAAEKTQKGEEEKKKSDDELYKQGDSTGAKHDDVKPEVEGEHTAAAIASPTSFLSSPSSRGVAAELVDVDFLATSSERRSSSLISTSTDEDQDDEDVINATESSSSYALQQRKKLRYRKKGSQKYSELSLTPQSDSEEEEEDRTEEGTVLESSLSPRRSRASRGWLPIDIWSNQIHELTKMQERIIAKIKGETTKTARCEFDGNSSTITSEYTSGGVTQFPWWDEADLASIQLAEDDHCIRAKGQNDHSSYVYIREGSHQAADAAGAGGHVVSPDADNDSSTIGKKVASADGETSKLALQPPVNRFEDDEFLRRKQQEYIAKTLPPEAIVLKLVGPYGAPAMSMWHFDSIILVGAGIGATPFAAMLRSANIKLKQRKILEKNVDGGGRGSKGSTTSAGGSNLKGLFDVGTDSVRKVVEEATRVPNKIEFHWIARNRPDFDWLLPWLMESMNGPARECTRIHLWITGGGDLKNLNKQSEDCPCELNEYAGRPNWAKIFEEAAKNYKGQRVGVFLCGSPMIGKALKSNCAKNTNLDEKTEFHYFEENF